MEAVPFDTHQIIPRSFGVHFGHDPIPLCFWVVSQQFSKEITSQARGSALGDLGFSSSAFAAFTLASLAAFAVAVSLSPDCTFIAFLRD